MPRIVSCFIPNAMTGFIASVFLFSNRVCHWQAFEVLEPDDGKLSRPVLRGPDPSNGVRLLGDNLVRLIEPMLSSAGAYPLALCTPWKQSSDDRPPCLENPRPEGAESTLTENVASPFHAEPRHECLRLDPDRVHHMFPWTCCGTMALLDEGRHLQRTNPRGCVVAWISTVRSGASGEIRTLKHLFLRQAAIPIRARWHFGAQGRI